MASREGGARQEERELRQASHRWYKRTKGDYGIYRAFRMVPRAPGVMAFIRGWEVVLGVLGLRCLAPACIKASRGE